MITRRVSLLLGGGWVERAPNTYSKNISWECQCPVLCLLAIPGIPHTIQPSFPRNQLEMTLGLDLWRRMRKAEALTDQKPTNQPSSYLLEMG